MPLTIYVYLDISFSPLVYFFRTFLVAICYYSFLWWKTVLHVFHVKFMLQSCAKELEWSLFQDSGRTIHSAEKNDTSYKRARFFTEMKQKKNQNGRLRKFKMAASKKPRFPAPPILNIFSWNFYGLVLGLVELIDAKGIEMSQLIWSWGCPTNSLKTQKTHFLSVFELMSDSLTTI